MTSRKQRLGLLLDMHCRGGLLGGRLGFHSRTSISQLEARRRIGDRSWFFLTVLPLGVFGLGVFALGGAALGCERAGAPRAAGIFDPCLTAPVEPSASVPHSRFDLCGNGLDDDGDGTIDDGCTCTGGTSERCYVGSPALAGIGACAWGTQHCTAEGTAASWGTCVGSGAPSSEVCGNGLDDDCDRAIDEDCACVLGVVQPCFPGASSELGVGLCTHGAQSCEEVAGLDGAATSAWGPCEGAVIAEAEGCDGLDEDCDGEIDDLVERCDGVDNDCNGEVDDAPLCRSTGMTMALTRFFPPTVSGVFTDLSTASLHTLVAVPDAPCPTPGDLLYEVDYGVLTCVPPPPTDCPLLSAPLWERDAERWTCTPCEVLVQYGYLFEYERVCADGPELICPPGEVPTFDEGARHWVCLPTCDNTDYDVVYANGMMVCVPC